MRTNVTAAHAKGLAVLLAMGLIVSSVPGAAECEQGYMDTCQKSEENRKAF